VHLKSDEEAKSKATKKIEKNETAMMALMYGEEGKAPDSAKRIKLVKVCLVSPQNKSATSETDL
jgi:hypothetical protein